MEFLDTCILILFFTVTFAIVVSSITKRNKNPKRGKLPPGPKPLPLIGNLLDLGQNPHKSLAKLADIHGPLMSLKFGQVTTIIVSSATTAKEILQTHDHSFCTRNLIQASQALDHHMNSVVWLPVGAQWRNLRKICNTHLFSNKKLDENQGLRYKKIQELLVEVQESCRVGDLVDINKTAFKAAANVLSWNVFSLNFSDSSSDIVQEFKKFVRDLIEELGKPNLADFFPFLRKFDPQRIKHRCGIYMGRILDLFDRIIDQRLESRKEEGYISANDMLDTLLDLCEDNSDEMNRNYMKHFFFDLFAAATDTTSNTVEWAMAELLHSPHTLSKARAEIEQTVSRGSRLQESDIDQLPYLKAIINETFRLHPPLPLLVPRKAGADVEICGFTIPKDAQVLVNTWAIGRDPSIWDDPEMFRPERFLVSNIDARGNHFELLPFGAGRRICVGLPLGIRMVHLILGSLIHSFDWKLEDGVTPESMDMADSFGISLQKAQSLRAMPIQV